ncbi:MAG: putative selenate reductase subunit YgfK [Bilifractor sp.]|jgi:putative selenate reductase
MSDIMRPMPYEQLLNWVLDEYEKTGRIFGVSKIVRHTNGQALPIFDEKIESPFGPAAGPNSQLTQNIVASYVAGSRFFELKTVQKMDGAELAACVSKPCIASGDECYNCEWSTELTVQQAFEEYVKAWFLCRILAKEYGLGDPDAFVFNMSVGYDLAGIQTKKVDDFIEGMKNAADTDVYKDAMEVSLKYVKEGRLKKADESFVRSIPARISNSITESTLHGCPPDEIERIASYLITEKKLNTYVKCNPTLLGYDFARKTLDSLGFDYIAFDDHHFLEDLQWKDAVPMFERLQKLSDENGVEFGVKLTNTFPVDVKAGELPSEEMYMSGKSLFPLTVELARRVSSQFGGKIRISYAGGADYFNIRDIFEAGIWPITMATNILKPGGYERLSQIADLLMDCGSEPFTGVDVSKVETLAALSLTSPRNRKPIKPLPNRKNGKDLPLLDCFAAPCRTNCPIDQDIPGYLMAMGEGRSEDAFRIIIERNAMPFTTGTLCPHTCEDRCMRNHYEAAVDIRGVKLQASEAAFEKVLPTLKAETVSDANRGKKVAVIGGGPAGLSTAYFLSRAGIPVTVFEKKDVVGGVPRHAIPGFRISNEALGHDAGLCRVYGAEVVTGREIRSIDELKSEGFTDIVSAIGAWAPGRKALKYGEALDALDFLEQFKADPAGLDLGENVVVIGGGNTAMDVARAAKRVKGVKNVRLVYRRTRRYMPADEEELQMAIDDGIEFRELLAPDGLKDGKIRCEICRLGDPDASGRRSPVGTGEFEEVPADTVITAVGERICADLYRNSGAALDEKGRPAVDENLQTSVAHFYAAGDGRRGPATVVKAIADAQTVAKAIAGVDFEKYVGANVAASEEKPLSKKGVMVDDLDQKPDRRCLGCPTVCEVCADVCPNRANVVVHVPGMRQAQIVHMDGMCNECGNCAVFCPYDGRPYRDKFTLFWSEEDFNHSENAGFLVVDGGVKVRLGDKVMTVDPEDENSGLFDGVRRLICAVLKDYSWLLQK